MLKNRLNKRVFEFSKELYKNLWFLIKKRKSKEYKLINLIIYFNTIIKRDTNLLSLINKFIKGFVKYQIINLIDLYLKYNQIILYSKNRDLIIFFILIGLIKNTRIL
jgi:hypothetical protein